MDLDNQTKGFEMRKSQLKEMNNSSSSSSHRHEKYNDRRDRREYRDRDEHRHRLHGLVSLVMRPERSDRSKRDKDRHERNKRSSDRWLDDLRPGNASENESESWHDYEYPSEMPTRLTRGNRPRDARSQRRILDKEKKESENVKKHEEKQLEFMETDEAKAMDIYDISSQTKDSKDFVDQQLHKKSCLEKLSDWDTSDSSSSSKNNDSKGINEGSKENLNDGPNDNSAAASLLFGNCLGNVDHSEDDLPGHADVNRTAEEPVEKKEEAIEVELPPYFPAIQGCRSVREFERLNRIEEGTYGMVYRARDKRTEEIVALKKLKMQKEIEGFPITSLREINTLLIAQHPNIVAVREIVFGSNDDQIFIVMDYVEHDLKSLMEMMRQKNQVFTSGEIKCLMQQLLSAVAHLHDNWILHRDLKTSNLLLSHRGILKVGDFGLAREYGSPLRQYTPVVVTLWYRAPELLLNGKNYSTPIDMWSVGCIFAELLRMEALFPGKSETDQLNRIFKELGTPNDRIWPGYSKLPLVSKATFANYPVNNLQQRFSFLLSHQGFELLKQMLTYDPAQRMTAKDALNHAYFTEKPLPIDPDMFPTWPAKSELGARIHNASPKPPKGGGEYEKLAANEDEAQFSYSGGFHMGLMDDKGRPPPVGGGFHLKLSL